MQVINTNISSLNSQRHLNNTQSILSTAIERLSSGKRINSAKDDAAGLGISDRMTTQINGMNQAIRNARDGISMSQTAEGALSTSSGMLQRIRTLAVQSSNATNASVDRQALQDEVNELTAELNRIAQTTAFNGQKLLDGTLGTQYYQVGANAGELIFASGSNFLTHVYGDYRLYSKAAAAAAGAALTDVITVSGHLGSSGAIDLKGMSAREAAALVNAQSGKTGVTVAAKTEAVFAATKNVAYSFAVQSGASEAVTVSFSVGEKQDADGYAAAVNAFNAVSAKTGVTAEYASDMGGIRLTQAAGETVTLSEKAGDGKAELNNIQRNAVTDAATVLTGGKVTAAGTGVVGTLVFDSSAGFSIAAGTTDFYSSAESSRLKAVAGLDVRTFGSAQLAIAICDAAIGVIGKEMARYGALQSRFESAIANLGVNAENTSNAKSRIMDADYAAETAEFSRSAILQQAGTAMLAQANQRPLAVLSLLG